MARVHLATCPLCEAMCGIRVTVEAGAVIDVRGDPDDPLSRGYVCPKAAALPDLQADPDRLRHPVRRNGDTWERVGWDEALDDIAARLHAIRTEHGKDAVASYLGNPTIHNLGAMLFVPELVRALGGGNRYSATSVDQLPQMLASLEMFGHQFLLPVPDLDHTELFVAFGANPLASNGSLMSAPGMKGRLKGLQARGGRLWVIDPRRTETAELADHHLAIRPGTDALLLAALVGIALERGRGLGALAAGSEGLDAVRAAVAGFTPESVEATVGVPAAAIHELASALCATDRAVVYGRMGVCTQRFGALNAWLINVLNAVTGNLDREGGAMFNLPAFDVLYPPAQKPRRGGVGRWRSRVRGLEEFGGELPASALAEEILTDGPGRIRALVTNAGNPVLSTPDGRTLDRALATLDFMVSIDPYLNETTRHAHYVLPPLPPLSRPHYDLALRALAVRNTARWADAVLPDDGDCRDEAWIASALARRLNRLRGAPWRDRLALRALATLGSERLVDLGLRLGPYGGLGGLSLAALRRSPSGVDLGPLKPGLLGRLGPGRDRVALAPERFLADLPRLRAALEEPIPDLLLIGRRDLRSNNSWMHNHRRLVKGPDRCTLRVHPDDATRHGLVDGGRARVRSRVGEVVVPVEVSDTLRPGVVSLPHGYGHDRGGRQAVAAERPGVSVNDLTDPALLDPVSGNAVLNGVPVTLVAEP